MTNVSAHAMSATALSKNSVKKRMSGSDFLAGPSTAQDINIDAWRRLADGSNYCQVDLTLATRAPLTTPLVMVHCAINLHGWYTGGNIFIKGGVEVVGPSAFSSFVEFWKLDRNAGDMPYGAGLLPITLGTAGAYSFYAVVYTYSQKAQFQVFSSASLVVWEP